MKQYVLWLVAVVVLAAATVRGQEGDRDARRGRGLREGGGPPPHMRHEGARPGPRGGDPGDRLEGVIGRILHHQEIQEELGLTEEQVEQLRRSFFASREKLVDLRAELEKAGMEQAQLMTADSIDEEALMQAVEQAGRARTKMAKLRMRQLVEIREVLTREQLDRARAAMRRRMREQHRRPRRERRPDRD